MLFNTDNKRYIEITDSESQELFLKKGNIKSIFNERLKKYGTLEPHLDDIEMKMKERDE